MKLSGYCASAIAHPLPVIPTQTLNFEHLIPTRKIRKTNSYPCPEQSITTVGELVEVIGCVLGFVHFALEDDGHDDAVDGHGLAHDDAGLRGGVPDEVLGTDTGGFDGGAQQGGACDEDTPGLGRMYQPAPMMEAARERAMPV